MLGGELVEVDGEVLEGLAGASHSAPWQKSLFKPSEEELLGLAELHKPFILSGCGGSLSKMATRTECRWARHGQFRKLGQKHP